MSLLDTIISYLPEINSPEQKKLSFKEKLKWTGVILVIFFVLGLIPLFGLGPGALSQFEMLSLMLGAKMGSLISLGIGPLVTASIVLQLLNGAGFVKFDLTSHEGKKKFQGVQKIMSLGFIVFEAFLFVFMGALSPSGFAGIVTPEMPIFFLLQVVLAFQVCLGGLLIMFMDEVISKWGFGSGISLFIAAGVSEQIFIRALSPLPSPTNPAAYTGAIPELFRALSAGDPVTAALMFAAVFFTILVFIIAVYVQAMKIEIPLSFGRIRGQGIRWPLNFIYTSNIPVILIAALMANLQMLAGLLQKWGRPILGTVGSSGATSGLISWFSPPNVVSKLIKGSLTVSDVAHSSVYMIIMIAGAVLFSVIWVQTSGMDARSQAKQIMASGLQIPGFRRDERVLERLLNRYIWPLTVMGAITVGFIAAAADLSGALSRGTGILLAVMIIYKLYEEIAKQHMYDMHPMMRKFME